MLNILTNFHMSICSQLCVTLQWFMHTKTFWHHYFHHIQKWFDLSAMTQSTPLAFLMSTKERYDAVPIVQLLSLLSTKKQFCQQISLIFVCVYIHSLPFISRCPFMDEMIGNTLRLLFQCRVWYCSVG